MPEYNFILAGRAGVGKTELFHYIKTGVAPKYDPDETTDQDLDDSRTALSDMGLERLEHETEANGREIKVNLWDTGGQERYDSMTANYYRHAHAVILVYDLEAEDTLYNLSDWIKEARKNSRWSDRLVFALWGNKADSQNCTARDEAILAFMTTHSINMDLSARVSTHTAGSIERAFQTLIEVVDKKFTQVGGIEETERDSSRLLLSMDRPENDKSRCFCL